jgi:hypothetical protein
MRIADRTRLRRLVFAATVLLAAPHIAGCAAALLAGAAGGAAVGTAAYVNGEHSQVYNANADRTWQATMAALKDMNIRVDKSNKDGLGGTIEGERADGTNVTVKQEPAENGNTQVKIRVGTFGDQAASEAIQQRIAARLRV